MKQYRLILLGSLFTLIPMGLYSKFYQGLFQNWVNNSLGGVFYVMFWIALVLWLKPDVNPKWSAVWVFIMTAFLECLQLWHPPILEAIRSTLMGRLLLGTTFVPSDFLYYGIGCGLSGWILSKIKSHSIPSKTEL